MHAEAEQFITQCLLAVGRDAYTLEAPPLGQHIAQGTLKLGANNKQPFLSSNSRCHDIREKFDCLPNCEWRARPNLFGSLGKGVEGIDLSIRAGLSSNGKIECDQWVVCPIEEPCRESMMLS